MKGDPAPSVPQTHIRVVYAFCPSCTATKKVRVEMLTPRPKTGTSACDVWIDAARREGFAKFEREHAAECRGRRG